MIRRSPSQRRPELRSCAASTPLTLMTVSTIYVDDACQSRLEIRGRRRQTVREVLRNVTEADISRLTFRTMIRSPQGPVIMIRRCSHDECGTAKLNGIGLRLVSSDIAAVAAISGRDT